MGASSQERVSAYRTRQREAGLPDVTRRFRKEDRHDYKNRRSGMSKSFTGCDGEGCGTDEGGRQLYTLFRMGERELYTGDRLGTGELLDFICDHLKGDILVGFAFGYDTTMILRDLPVSQQRRLFEPKTFGKGRSPFVWYKEFDIDYLPKQYLKVRKVQTIRDAEGKERRVPIPGSCRTIYETFGFFQKSFLKAVSDFEVGTDAQRRSIAEQKARRSEFETIGDVERAYCALECDLLAQLMEKLREACYATGIRPRSWNGAGKLAAALHGLHDTPRWKDVAPLVPAGLADMANMAYYGGRFEISRVGAIKGEVNEYDIRSAYPDAMRRLPCLQHGTWEKASAKSVRNWAGLYLAPVTFKAAHSHSSQAQSSFGGLPVRSREGYLYWPRQGGGVYWSPEINSAVALGYEIVHRDGWVFHKGCDCRVFDWVNTLYEYRRSLGASGIGYPIKLGINSLYGKLAQRKGNGSYNNMIWAGLITALTRAKLNEAICESPSDIVMLATDAVYSRVPLPGLSCGSDLGQWEHSVLNGLFIVQPGLYWCPEKRKRKSRGLPGKFFETEGMTEGFEDAWKYFAAQQASSLACDYPSVSVQVPNFVGLKLALSRNAPESAGRWTEDVRNISFDYRNKRQGHAWAEGHITLGMKPGHPGLVSLPHRDFLAAGGQEPWENARAMLEEQPDYIDLGPPFQD